LLSFLSAVSDVFSGYLLSGESMPGSAGMGFTPHVVHVAIGEVSYFSHFKSVQCCGIYINIGELHLNFIFSPAGHFSKSHSIVSGAG
jgi:hypothetical protein